MTQERGLLQAILANPDDDATRLVFADWLEEYGQSKADQARAEFIRLQLTLARELKDSPDRREQAFRMRNLLDRYREVWLAPFQHFLFHNHLFARGFLDQVGLMAGDLDAHAEAVFAQIPLRRLWVTDLLGDVSVFRRIPADNRLRELDLCGNALDCEALEALAELPNLGALQSLGLLFTDLAEDSVPLLCEHPFCRRLSLRCGGNPLTEGARERLREHFGTRVSFDAERDDDYLYAIQNDRFTAGFGHHYTQILCYGTRDRLRLIQFDHTGRLLTHQDRDVLKPERPATPWQELPMEVRKALLNAEDECWRRTERAWLDELGYQPATIGVQRFRLPDGSGIQGFADGWVQVLETPDHPEGETARGWLDRWLVDGKFAYEFVGNDWWLNEAGEVTDT
jgi:uncharacterized protein (TIGR02996 family)